MYPIMKKKGIWSGQIEHTCPILLLECARKMAMKVLNNRIRIICETEDILQGMNFCGLTKDSITEPINLLRNAMDTAFREDRECWLLLQDIRKAFDSVGKEVLRASLERLKMNEKIIRLLVNTFANRNIQVITSFSLATLFHTDD